MFRDRPFLGCSSFVSLVTAANFRLLLNVGILLTGRCHAVMKTDLVFIRYLIWDYNEKIDFLKETTSRIQHSQLIIKVILRICPLILWYFVFTPLPWRETYLLRRQVKVRSRKKYFNYIIYKEKMPNLTGNKHFSLHFPPHRQRHLHLSIDSSDIRDSTCQKWASKYLFQHRR